ncbi:MAG: hypothetical protein KAH57_02725 [Thermoplasmata archaeon]|nr:hypothetical protein [Thermoplasmata archaeon]
MIYPTCLFALLLLNLPGSPLDPAYWVYLIASFIFLFVNLVRKFIDPKNSWVQSISRVFIGLSLALAITSMLNAPGMSLKVVIGILILTVGITYNLINGLYTWNYCKKCPQHDDFPECEGNSTVEDDLT